MPMEGLPDISLASLEYLDIGLASLEYRRPWNTAQHKTHDGQQARERHMPMEGLPDISLASLEYPQFGRADA